MPGYRISKMEKAGNLSSEALSKFNQGTKARAIADDYVLNTVFLATVLVLTAISQRFHIKSIRTGLLILSFLLLLFAITDLPCFSVFDFGRDRLEEAPGEPKVREQGLDRRIQTRLSMYNL